MQPDEESSPPTARRVDLVSRHDARRHMTDSLKGGDPAAGSPTATLLRLSPNHGGHLRRLPLREKLARRLRVPPAFVA